MPVAPAFQIVTVLFALLLGFLAADVWAQQRHAVDAAFKEALAFTRLQTLSDTSDQEALQARQMLLQYRTAVAETEWGLHANHVADPSAASALKTMRLHSLRLGNTLAATEWMRSVGDLEEARQRRLLIGSDTTDTSQWTLVLVLGFFAAAALTVCHMDRPPAARLILFIFAVALSLVLWQLARHTNPYSGGDVHVSLPAVLSR